MDENWAEKIPTNVMKKVLSIGEGHAIIPSEELIEVGLNKEVVDKFTHTHKSIKRPSYMAVEIGADVLREELTLWSGDDKTKFCVEDVPWDNFVKTMFEKLMEEDIHEISGYSPKETIFKNGQIVEEMEGVYDLDLASGIAANIGLSYVSKIGRGFQYSEICKSIHEYLETRDVEK